MRTLSLAIFAAVLTMAGLTMTGCGKGDQSKPMGAAGDHRADNTSQTGSANPPGAGATGLGATGEGGGGVGPEHTGRDNSTGSD